MWAFIKNPFTKDFRGGEEKNESIDYFLYGLAFPPSLSLYTIATNFEIFHRTAAAGFPSLTC